MSLEWFQPGTAVTRAPLTAVAAVALLVGGAALQACGGTDPGAPAPATAATSTAAPATAATSSAATPTPTAPATAAPVPAATPTAATPTPTATPPAGGGGGIRILPKDTGARKPPASSNRALEDEPGRVGAGEEPPKQAPESEGAAGQPPGTSSGRVYTWQDGEHTRRVVLQADLTVRPTNEVGSQDEVVAFGGASAVVQGGGGQPVFRSESGELMTLPGGVLLALDQAWSDEQVRAFLQRNAIAGSRVSDLGWLPNGYFIETAPGFASLDLANALAGQDGVVLAAPNWWREAETR